MHADLGDQCNACAHPPARGPKMGHMCPLSLIGVKVVYDDDDASPSPTTLTPYPTPKPTSPLVVRLGESGELDCPAGFITTNDPVECERAADLVERDDGISGGYPFDASATGCVIPMAEGVDDGCEGAEACFVCKDPNSEFCTSDSGDAGVAMVAKDYDHLDIYGEIGGGC